MIVSIWWLVIKSTLNSSSSGLWKNDFRHWEQGILVTVCARPLEVLVFADELDSEEAGLAAAGFGVDVLLLVEVTVFIGMTGFILLKDSWSQKNKYSNSSTSVNDISWKGISDAHFSQVGMIL